MHATTKRTLVGGFTALFWTIAAVATPVACAQPSADPPVVGRPADFSGISGSVRLECDATPTDLEVESPLVLRVRFLGQVDAKHAPIRSALRLFPEEFSDQFFVENAPSLDTADPKQGRWEFVYRLRPKRVAVQAIEGIRLSYYHPGRGKYQTAYADAIALRVRRRAPVEVKLDPALVASIPKSFLEIAPVEDIEAWNQGREEIWWPWVAMLAPPLLFAGTWLMRAKWFPDEATARRHSQSQAAAVAIQQLEGDSDGEIREVLAEYLRARFDFVAEEPTPGDLGRWARVADWPKALRGRWEALWRRLDAHAFSPSESADSKLRNDALALIHDQEAWLRHR